MAAGVTNTPTIPPGLIAIVVAAGLVAFVPARRVTLAGTAAGLLNLGVFIVVGATDRLIEANPEAAFVAAWCMVVALVVASIAGTLATIEDPPGAAGGKRVHEPSQAIDSGSHPTSHDRPVRRGTQTARRCRWAVKRKLRSRVRS
jgi:hypothetical protein